MRTPTLAAALLLLLSALAAAPAAAQSYPEVGARALGMGGAFVAVADGPTAVYWNPAALPFRPAAGTFVWGEQTSDQEELAARLNDLARTNALDPSIVTRPADAARAVQLLGDISANPAPISGSHPVGAFFANRNWGFTIHRLTLTDATPIVDQRHTELSLDPLSGLPYNESRLNLRSLEADEYVLALASDLGDQRVMVGGNVRYTRGKTFLARPSLFSFPDASAGDIVDLADSDALESETESAWSFDVATLISFHPRFRAGLVGRYLGTPEFELGDGSLIRLEPTWRTGVAIFPHQQVTLSADLDLTSTSPFLGSEDVRDFALGGQVSFGGGAFALRSGWRGRIDGPEATLVTVGAGVVARTFRLDGAVGFSTGGKTFAVELGFGKSEAQRAPAPTPGLASSGSR